MNTDLITYINYLNTRYAANLSTDLSFWAENNVTTVEDLQEYRATETTEVK